MKIVFTFKRVNHSQHVREIPGSKYVWRHANSFQYADRRSDCCILCPFHIQEKSENGLAQLLADAKTGLSFFYPQAQRKG